MRWKTTEIRQGKSYRYHRGIWDGFNDWLKDPYPQDALWLLDGREAVPRLLPFDDEILSVVEPELVCDEDGTPSIPTNARGRPFVSVRGPSGSLYGPIDPQHLYPLDEVADESLAYKVSFLAFWVVIFPIGVGLAIVGTQMALDPEVASTGWFIVVAVSLAVIVAAAWWFLRIRAERQREGSWRSSIRVGLAVGAVMLATRIGGELFGGS